MIKIVYVMTSCRRCGPTQQTLNIIKNLDRNVFYPILITLYKEHEDSKMHEYLQYVGERYFLNLSKFEIILHRLKKLGLILEAIKPNVVHTVGVFPDYAVYVMKKYKQIHTIRNYVFDDYISKFGFLKGNILAFMQLKVIKSNHVKSIACSKSLQLKYKEDQNIDMACIQNGIDIEACKCDRSDIEDIRQSMGIADSAFVFCYSGQFIPRKNVEFILENFKECFCNINNVVLLLLGDGPDFARLQKQYNCYSNIIFLGNVEDVFKYLKIANVYVSASKSEGLPNGVLEAMASSLPLLLSDIPQHREIFYMGRRMGYIYDLNSVDDFRYKLKKLVTENCNVLGECSYDTVLSQFNAITMSKKYQEMYEKF